MPETTHPVIAQAQAHELLPAAPNRTELLSDTSQTYIVGNDPAPNRPASSVKITGEIITDITDPELVSIDTDLGVLLVERTEILTLHIYREST